MWTREAYIVVFSHIALAAASDAAAAVEWMFYYQFLSECQVNSNPFTVDFTFGRDASQYKTEQ